MHLTICKLTGLLHDAKEAHTRYEERFRLEGANPPEHTWEAWYAKFIMTRLQEQEYSETFGGVKCNLEGVGPISAVDVTRDAQRNIVENDTVTKTVYYSPLRPPLQSQTDKAIWDELHGPNRIDVV